MDRRRAPGARRRDHVQRSAGEPALSGRARASLRARERLSSGQAAEDADTMDTVVRSMPGSKGSNGETKRWHPRLPAHRRRIRSCLLVHPGGPFWAKRDRGAWSIPKGELEEGEHKLQAAKREFREETGLPIDGDFIALAPLRQAGGKLVHAWAVNGEIDPFLRQEQYVFHGMAATLRNAATISGNRQSGMVRHSRGLRTAAARAARVPGGIGAEGRHRADPLILCYISRKATAARTSRRCRVRRLRRSSPCRPSDRASRGPSCSDGWLGPVREHAIDRHGSRRRSCRRRQVEVENVADSRMNVGFLFIVPSHSPLSRPKKWPSPLPGGM